MGRKILSGVLLAFVAIALITVAMRGRAGGDAATTKTIPTQAQPTTVATSHLVAFYFHGAKRCTSCNTIERLTREALQAEITAGVVELRPVNVDEAENAHYVDDFQLTMRTVVLAEESAGRVARWKRLDECWGRFDDPADFNAYITASMAAFRAPAAP